MVQMVHFKIIYDNLLNNAHVFPFRRLLSKQMVTSAAILPKVPLSQNVSWEMVLPFSDRFPDLRLRLRFQPANKWKLQP